MTDIKARYVGPQESVTLGVILEDGDLYPLTIPQGGELPQEVDGRKVSAAFRDNLLAQEDNWTKGKESKTAKAEKEEDK